MLNSENEKIQKLQDEVDELKIQLYEANGIIEAIRDGSVDALVVNKDGNSEIYAIESADYTYRILIEKFGEGALSISDDGLILYCNDYFSQLISVPSNQIVGSYLSEYLASKDDLKLIQTALQNGTSKGEIFLKTSKKQIPVYVSLTDLHPNVAAIGVVVTDFTEKKKNEEALVNYQKALELKVNELHTTNTNLEQFIHVISHDLKEPIRKIVSYASYLQSTKSNIFAEGETNTLDIVKSSALRLNSLVDDLVKYAFNATKGENETVNLNAIINDVIDDLELSINDNDVQLKIENLPSVNGSRVQMRQLFSNLMANAIKYAKQDEKPKIEIGATIENKSSENSSSEKWHKISISDNGIGMDKSDLTKIFTIFQRLHMRNEYSGNGIGLAICKKIMENHAGRIEVESALNQGSTFHLYFPVIN